MKEKIVYLSDTHGNTETLKRLGLYLEDPPNHLICLGDHFVTPSYRKIQDLFYNRIVNPTRKLLGQNPTITEIINSFYGLGLAIKEAYLELKSFENQLAKGSEPLFITDEELASGIHQCLKYLHYGHYTSNTSVGCKDQLGSELEENAFEFCNMLNKFIMAGASTHNIEGNQDARTPIDFKPGILEVIPLPIEERVFHAGSYLTERGFNFYDGTGVFITKATVQVIIAFDETIRATDPDYQFDKNILEFINTERQNKTVIMSIHGMVDMNIFGLGEISLNAEGKACLGGSQKLLSIVKPNIIIHGHYHNPKLTEKIIVDIPFDPNTNDTVKIIYLPENTIHEMIF